MGGPRIVGGLRVSGLLVPEARQPCMRSSLASGSIGL